MKRYVKATTDDEYCVIRIDSLYDDTGYLGVDGGWYNRPYDSYIIKYSKSGAYRKAKQLNAKNTDDSLRYEAKKLDNIIYN